MAHRHDDALLIQEGACNPCGIARALVKALDEARAEGLPQREDPAARLIVHQLCYLFGMVVDDYHFPAPTDPAVFDWTREYEACKRLASPDVLKRLQLDRGTVPVTRVIDGLAVTVDRVPAGA